MPALRSQGEFFMTGVVPICAQPESSDCSICTEHLAEDVVQLAGGCGHMFHAVCLLSWLSGTGRQNRTCPNCRQELYAEPARQPSNSRSPMRTVDSIMARRIDSVARARPLEASMRAAEASMRSAEASVRSAEDELTDALMEVRLEEQMERRRIVDNLVFELQARSHIETEEEEEANASREAVSNLFRLNSVVRIRSEERVEELRQTVGADAEIVRLQRQLDSMRIARDNVLAQNSGALGRRPTTMASPNRLDTPLTRNSGDWTRRSTIMASPDRLYPDRVARARRAALRAGRRDRVPEEDIGELYGFPAVAQALDGDRFHRLNSSSQGRVYAQATAELDDMEEAEGRSDTDYDLPWRTPGTRYH